MDVTEILKWIGGLIISIGGVGVIMIAIAKWFGDRMANVLLEKDKAHYQEELETLKNKFNQDLETRKSELEKSNSIFFRYSEHQFILYNELWKSLCDLQQTGEELWNKAAIEQLKAFSKQLNLTKLSVNKSALLLEKKHYRELLDILNRFGDFEIGKMKLISLRNRQAHELMRIDVEEINHVVQRNRNVLDEFNQKLDDLIKPFKKQIKGEGFL